ncbi:hypothetical protein B0G73_13748 [Paraburkholderia sp. BL25I1N1]|nr:hypothetical protein B0G73_13748 [Paraburkholderia sp. BL25I1N1]
MSLLRRTQWRCSTGSAAGAGVDFIVASGGWIQLRDRALQPRDFHYSGAGVGLPWERLLPTEIKMPKFGLPQIKGHEFGGAGSSQDFLSDTYDVMGPTRETFAYNALAPSSRPNPQRPPPNPMHHRPQLHPAFHKRPLQQFHRPRNPPHDEHSRSHARSRHPHRIIKRQFSRQRLSKRIIASRPDSPKRPIRRKPRQPLSSIA